jgi:hypothetical protein
LGEARENEMKEKKKVYWASEHNLSSAQLQAIKEIHGYVRIEESVPHLFRHHRGLAEYIRAHRDGFVYADTDTANYLYASCSGLPFGIFENHYPRRTDGTVGIATVYHIFTSFLQGYGESATEFKRVWVNSNPKSDKGRVLNSNELLNEEWNYLRCQRLLP